MDKPDPDKPESESRVIEINRGSKSTGPADAAGEAGRSDATDPEPAAADERVSRLQAEREELMQTLVRRQADFENYRKRVERERSEDHRRGIGRLIEELLPVLDAFERALKAHDDPAYEEYRRGLELIYRQLWDILAREGLERIVAAGKQFNPHYHQAVERVETEDYEDGSIVEVLQDGFLFHGRVLRPSAVRVAVHPGEAGGESSAARHRAN
jgi:molecular chaperone GrpE